jgi:hypothetical protein
VANFLALNPEGLVAEFRDLRVVAERARQTTTCSNASAWAAAIHDTQTSPKRRACYKVRHLLPALRRYMVYSGSSSGVEQCFSTCKFLMGERRSRERAKQRVLVLSSSARHATKDAELCSSARLIWAINFGVPRAKRQAALPERLQVQALRRKRKAEDPHNQASQQLRRRTALETVARDLGLPALAAQAAHHSAQLRTDGHTKELQRQQRVRECRRLDAALDGTLGVKGNTGLADDALEKHLDARRKRNAQFWKQRDGKDQARRNPTIMAVCPGTTVFVETSAWEPALGDAFSRTQVQASGRSCARGHLGFT